MHKAVLAGAVVLAMSAAPVFAQSATQTNRKNTPKSTTAHNQSQKAVKATGDQHFVTEAAKGGIAEVSLGQLAEQKASSDEVKNFAKRMVTDHSKANDELKSIAQNKNITLPTQPDPKEKAAQERLSKLSGDSFDRAYMQHMLQDHRKDVNEFRMESKSGRDSDVKAWAAKTLPTLEEHLKQAQDANKAVGTSGHVQKGARAKATKGTKNPKSKSETIKK